MSSVCIPKCLRYSRRPILSNTHWSQESVRTGLGTRYICDLEETVTLNSVSLILAEYIPSGTNANKHVHLNHNVGAVEWV